MNGFRPMPYIFFTILVAANVFFWVHSRTIQPAWANVPPVPSVLQASASALGDTQLAYRGNAIMLTNLGSTGGQVQNFAEYDYERLKNWFFLSDKLDNQSKAVPYLAAYYYSAVTDPEKRHQPVEPFYRQ